MQLASKVAIVTGASRGIGKAIAIELARAGASVAVAARTEQRGQSSLLGTIHETVEEIEKLGGKAITVLNVDSIVSEEMLKRIKKADNIIDAKLIKL